MIGNKDRKKGPKNLKPAWKLRLEKDLVDLESDPFIKELISFPDGANHPEKIAFSVIIILKNIKI